MVSWLTSALAGPILGALLLVVGTFAIAQTLRIDGYPFVGGGLEDELQAAAAARQAADANANAYQDASDRCNASVSALGAVAAKWTEKAQADVDTAQGKARQAADLAAKILAMKTQGNECAAALALVREKSP